MRRRRSSSGNGQIASARPRGRLRRARCGLAAAGRAVARAVAGPGGRRRPQRLQQQQRLPRLLERHLLRRHPRAGAALLQAGPGGVAEGMH